MKYRFRLWQIRQINGEYEAKESRMQKYLKLTNQIIGELEQVNFIQVLWSQNSKVAIYTSSKDGTSLPNLKLEIQKFPSIEEFHTFSIHGDASWMTLILSYLKDGQLLLDLEKARKIKKLATRFIILNNALYERVFSLTYLRCIE